MTVRQITVRLKVKKLTFPIFLSDFNINNGNKRTFIENANIDCLPHDENLKY